MRGGNTSIGILLDMTGYVRLLLVHATNPFSCVHLHSVLIRKNKYIYIHSTVSHRSEYTPHIFVNILLYIFM